MPEPPLPPDPPAPDPSHRRSEEVAAQVASAKRRRRRALLWPPAVFLGALLAGEIVARLGGASRVTWQTSHAERGWQMKPGSHALDGASATIAPSGTRGAEQGGGLLILGDGAAFGAGLADADTLAPTAARASGLPVTLAAADGYGTEQEVLWLRELAPRLKPRVVAVVFSYDDPRLFASTLFTRLRFTLRSLSALAASAFPGAAPPTREELRELYVPDGIPFSLWRDSVRKLGKWSREGRTPVIFAIWPVMAAKQDDALLEYYEQVRGEARAEGLIVLPLVEAFGESGLDRLPKQEAHRRAGEAIGQTAREVVGGK